RLADLLQHRPPREARAFALGAVAEGDRARDVYLDMLAPALVEIGDRWQRGAATVAQEHLATAVVASIMATLAPTLEELPAVRQRIVLACTAGEMHDLGLRMLGDFLEGDGWEVLLLGAVMPAQDLAAFVAEANPVAVGLSVTLTTHLEFARDTIAAIRERSGAYILVGGAAFRGDASSVARNIRADDFALDAGAASKLLRARFGEQAS
ncbi:MAG: cobalamin-dependent protein, partial [Pseudomonadota bacterium]|nr:cobalamin-dependent protein [Pseudomonadota bacterium]